MGYRGGGKGKMAVQGVSVAGIQAVLETSRTTLEVTSLAPHRGLSQNELGEGTVPLGSQGPQNIKTRPFSGTVRGHHGLCAFLPIGRVDPVVSSIPSLQPQTAQTWLQAAPT